MIIRKAAPADYPRIRTFYHEVIDGMQTSGYDIGWKKDIYPAPDYLQESIENEELFIGEENGCIAAAMVMNHQCNEGYAEFSWPTEAAPEETTMLHTLGIHPAFSCRGYGKQMVKYAIETAKQNDQKVIRLDVLKGNVPAERLYTGLGFRYLHTLSMFYEDTGWTDFELYELALNSTDILQQAENAALQSGLYESGYVNISNLQFHEEIRSICEGNVCRNFGTSWACPPAVGTLQECRARVEQYSHMLLFSKKYDLEDSFDFEGMREGLWDFKRTVDRFEQEISGLLQDYQLLSNEGCGRCEACTYPDAPCRFPEKLHHSLEGYGFIVSDLAKEAGIHYINGANTVTYFGVLLFG